MGAERVCRGLVRLDPLHSGMRPCKDRDLVKQVLEFVNAMPVLREEAILAQRSRAPVERGLER